MKNYYVYQHFTDKLTPFYIGKGHGDRMSQKKNRNSLWHKVANKHGFNYRIVADNLTEEQAFEIEMLAIKTIGKRIDNTGPLTNITDGGEGVSGITPWNKGLVGHPNHVGTTGYSHSSKSKAKIAKSMIGKNKSAYSERSQAEFFGLGRVQCRNWTKQGLLT